MQHRANLDAELDRYYLPMLISIATISLVWFVRLLFSPPFLYMPAALGSRDAAPPTGWKVTGCFAGHCIAGGLNRRWYYVCNIRNKSCAE